jgi:soluble lytic murein transglycosylase-like protein
MDLRLNAVSERTSLMAIAMMASTTCSSVFACWDEAGQRYGIKPSLLRAIAMVESNGHSGAVNQSHFSETRSFDVGLMQINTRWLPKLQTYGYSKEHLLDPCASVHLGAWILSDLFAKHGSTWVAVGAYNAACTQLKGAACDNARAKYAQKVARQLKKIEEML